MFELELSQCIKVAGAAYLTGDTEYHESVNFYEAPVWYIPPDGSLPYQLQERVDSGESFDSMSHDLMIFQFAVEIIKIRTPEYLQ